MKPLFFQGRYFFFFNVILNKVILKSYNLQEFIDQSKYNNLCIIKTEKKFKIINLANDGHKKRYSICKRQS